MKRWMMISLAELLILAVLCAPAIAQPGTPAGSDEAQDRLIKSEVETAVSMLQAIYARYQQGDMTLEKAKSLGANLLREMKYGEDGYFWVDTTEGVNVVLYGRKDVEGRNRLNDRDVNGKYYIREFIEKANAGGGYADYWFPKKGEAIAQLKRSFVMPFEPFGWIVGSGYYPVAGEENKDSAVSRALDQIKLFAGLTEAERDALKGSATVRRAKAGERIIEQGKRQDSILIIMDSQAEVRINGKHVVTLPAQSLLGELEFLDALPAAANVFLLQDTNVIEWTHATLTALMEKQPRLGYVLMSGFAKIEAQRLRAMSAN